MGDLGDELWTSSGPEDVISLGCLCRSAAADRDDCLGGAAYAWVSRARDSIFAALAGAVAG